MLLLLTLACLSPAKESEDPGCTPWPSTCDGAAPPSQPCRETSFYCDLNKCVWACGEYGRGNWEWRTLRHTNCTCVQEDGSFDTQSPQCGFSDNDTGTCIP